MPHCIVDGRIACGDELEQAWLVVVADAITGLEEAARAVGPAVACVDLLVAIFAYDPQHPAVVGPERAGRPHDRVPARPPEYPPVVHRLFVARLPDEFAPRAIALPVAADLHPCDGKRSYAVLVEEVPAPGRPETTKTVALSQRSRRAGSA